MKQSHARILTTHVGSLPHSKAVTGPVTEDISNFAQAMDLAPDWQVRNCGSKHKLG